ncbi:putative hydroxymethylpyrimidine transporter CytX [Oscillospiraceae bacterium PP1C4]
MSNTEKSSSISQGLLWFGAAVSIAEILTGALLAPLGFARGMWAIIIGHLIGCAVLYLTGFIGAQSGLSAIESTRISFGKYGSYWFSILNVVQLLGWTAVMIINGAKSLNAVTPQIQNEPLWCIVIGGLICIWILVGMKNLAKVNAIVVTALFIFTLILGFVVFRGMNFADTGVSDAMSFGVAVELSVTMPLSWLPLISDYTRTVKHKKAGTLMSAAGYFIGSCMMYAVGLGAAIYTGTDDIATILVTAGLGAIALLIVIFSTVTTTFLDAYSGGVSIVNLNHKINEKGAALAICIIGTVMAIFIPTTQYENFLYLIGSVFAPLFAVLITDYFILKVTNVDESARLNVKNSVIWVLGFTFYRLIMRIDSPVGTTLPTMLFTMILCIVIHQLIGRKKQNV